MSMRQVAAIGWAGAVLAVMASQALAACPQELAVYGAPTGGSQLEFVGGSDAVAMRHEIRLLVTDDLVMTGFVGLTQIGEQTYFLVPHECPEGDVTGEELAQCMAYESVVYGIDAQGLPGPLPPRGDDAATALLLPGFLQAVAAQGERFGDDAVAAASDVFQLSGCQE